uniref:Uncharacterized protein n=1 Tax=Arundo donax TaxID=35708 RepID=A0A0A9BA21_ARUDO
MSLTRDFPERPYTRSRFNRRRTLL